MARVHRRALRSSVSIRRDGETQRRDSGPPRLTPRPASPFGERSGGCGAVIELPIPGMTISRPHQGDSQCNKRPVAVACRFASPCRMGRRMVGPVTRPKPASPHGTPLPGKRATADGKSPCHMRRENHSALAMPVVGSGPAAESGGKGFALGGRRRMVGPAIRPKPASPHGTPLPGKRATAGGKLPCHMRRWERSALGDANRREEASRRPDLGARPSDDPGGGSGPSGVAHGGAPNPSCARQPHIALSPKGIRLRHGE